MDLSFAEFSQRNPCVGCPAPCCRMQLIPYKIPTSFVDLDFVHYMLLFPNTEVLVKSNGEWNIIKWENCSCLDTNTHTCSRHDTTEKPKICAMYNPYQCWYKSCFVLNDSQEIYRFNLARFKMWISEIKFTEEGNILSVPNIERLLEIIKDIPIEPNFQPLYGGALASDPRLAAVNRPSKVENKNNEDGYPMEEQIIELARAR